MAVGVGLALHAQFMVRIGQVLQGTSSPATTAANCAVTGCLGCGLGHIAAAVLQALGAERRERCRDSRQKNGHQHAVRTGGTKRYLPGQMVGLAITYCECPSFWLLALGRIPLCVQGHADGPSLPLHVWREAGRDARPPRRTAQSAATCRAACPVPCQTARPANCPRGFVPFCIPGHAYPHVSQMAQGPSTWRLLGEFRHKLGQGFSGCGSHGGGGVGTPQKRL